MSLFFKSFYFKVLAIIFFSLIVTLGIYVRILLADNHFIGGVDDLGVAKSIIDFDNSIDFYKSTHPEKTKKLLYSFKGYPFLNDGAKLWIIDNILNFRLWWNHKHVIPNNWTYAPFQFYFTEYLINSNMNLSQVKFWGRFPSLTFSIFSIYLIFIIFKNYSKILLIDKKTSIFLSVTLLCLSWQNIIYAAQMHSFSIGVFSVLLLIYILLWILNNDDTVFCYKKAYLLGLFLGLLAMTQYQLLFFFPGFVVAVLFKFYHSISKKVLFIYFLLILFGFLTLALFFVFPNLAKLQNHGINWNKGPNDIFLFSLDQRKGFLFNVTYFVKFFAQNSMKVILAMLSPIAQFNLFTKFYMIVFSFFIGIGYFSLLKGNKIRFLIFVFVTITFLLWMLLLLTQKITLSPSRHSMVLIPLFILLFISGWNRIINSNLISTFSLLFCVLFFSSFLFFLQEEIDGRRDLIKENEFSDLIKKDSSMIILSYQTNYNVNFMQNSIANNISLMEINNPWGNLNNNYILSNKIMLDENEFYLSAFSSSREINKDDIAKFRLFFKDETSFSPKEINLVYCKVLSSKKQPDWAFPRINNFSFNSYYYYLFKIVF